MTLSSFCHSQGVKQGTSQRQLPSPIYARGGRGRWLAGSFLVLRPYQRTGGDEEQGTTITQDNVSYVLSSTIIKLYIPNGNNFPNSDNGQSIHPLVPFPPQLEGSASQSVLYLDHSRGPVVVPVGTWTGDSRIRVFLSNRGGPIKVPGLVKSRKQNENPKPVSSIT